MRLISGWLVVLCAVVPLGCGDDHNGCEPGTEGCQCSDDKACDKGLTCASNLCVEIEDEPEAGSRAGEGGGGSGGDGGESGEGGTAGEAGAAGEAEAEAAGEAGTAGQMEAGTGGEAGSGKPDAGCEPDRADRECGPDPACEESCGSCPRGFDCVEGACISATPLKENGEMCSDASECASGLCAENQVGELHCYGDGPNDVCGDTYDCAGGLCLVRSLSGTQKVCVEGFVMCDGLGVSDDCEAYVLAFCRFGQFCSPTTEDFDICIGVLCQLVYEEPPSTGCRSMTAFILSGQAECV